MGAKTVGRPSSGDDDATLNLTQLLDAACTRQKLRLAITQALLAASDLLVD